MAEFPKELTPELAKILGRPNFTCVGLADALRRAGFTIQRKAEAEQAAVIHWLVCVYLEHGDDWAQVAQRQLDAITGES